MGRLVPAGADFDASLHQHESHWYPDRSKWSAKGPKSAPTLPWEVGNGFPHLALMGTRWSTVIILQDPFLYLWASVNRAKAAILQACTFSCHLPRAWKTWHAGSPCNLQADLTGCTVAHDPHGHTLFIGNQ